MRSTKPLVIMTKPRRVQCQVDGCKSGRDEDGNPEPYWTDPDCGSVAERSNDLRDHVQMVHTMAKYKEELRIR